MRYPHVPWPPPLFYPALPVAAAVAPLLWRAWPLTVPFMPWAMALICAATCFICQRSQTLAQDAPWALCVSLAHEGFHMAFLDELTGLRGRRAIVAYQMRRRVPEAVIKAADQAFYRAEDGRRTPVCPYRVRRRTGAI